MRYIEPTIVLPYTEVEVNDELYDQMEKFSLATQTHPAVRPDWLRFLEKNPAVKDTDYRSWAKVGSMVYPPYGSQSPGIVVATYLCEEWRRGDRQGDRVLNGSVFTGRKPMWTKHVAHVRWLPGKKEAKKKNPEIIETLEDVSNLQSFQALINDHKKKLETHESKVKLLEDLLNAQKA